MGYLYTIVNKIFSSQPDIPWGIIRTVGPLETSAIDYIDGYDLTWGWDRTTAEVPERVVSDARWENISKDFLSHDFGSRPIPGLTDLSLEEMLDALPKKYGPKTWETSAMIPYILAFFKLEKRREDGE